MTAEDYSKAVSTLLGWRQGGTPADVQERISAYYARNFPVWRAVDELRAYLLIAR